MKLHLPSLSVRAGAFILAWLGYCCAASAGPRVDIVVGPQAPKLERFAAAELAGQLSKLYDADATVVEQAPGDMGPLVLLGSPTTNPAVKQAAGANWPKLSDQGHLLRSVKLKDRDGLIVGGGSPQATLWAAYEFGHRCGVRYLLSGDVYPAEPGELRLSSYDALLEPSLKDRTWVGLGAEPIGTSAWGLDDQKRLVGQLAKLKFNRVVLRFEPWQPFVDFECHGVHKRTAQLWRRESWPIDSETPGRAAFHGAKELLNPDFAGKTDYAAKTRAGIALARGVFQRARQLGMSAGAAMAPFEFPAEFAETFASQPLAPSGGRAVGFKAPGQLARDEASRQLTASQLAACLKSYPEIDALYLARTRRDDALHDNEQGGIDDAKPLLDPRGKFLPEGDGRKVERFLWNVSLASDKAPGASHASGTIVAPAGITDRAGRQSELLSLIGPTPRMLPQASLDELHSLLKRLRASNASGFAVECGMPGDLDPYVFYLARGAFDAELTPEAACEELVAPMCGAATAERLLLGFRAVERASSLAAEHDPEFSVPHADVVMRHYQAGSPPAAWQKEAKEGYLAGLTESLRAKDRSLLPGRPWLRYLGKRMEFAFEYMNAIEQAQLAGQAKKDGDAEAQLTHLEGAVEAMYNSLHALGEVAQDQSDRAVIAVLAEYGYRPLVKELEKADDAAE